MKLIGCPAVSSVTSLSTGCTERNVVIFSAAGSRRCCGAGIKKDAVGGVSLCLVTPNLSTYPPFSSLDVTVKAIMGYSLRTRSQSTTATAEKPAAKPKATVAKAATTKTAASKSAPKTAAAKAAPKKAAVAKTAVTKAAPKKAAVTKTAVAKTAVTKAAVAKAAVAKTAVAKTSVAKTAPKKAVESEVVATKAKTVAPKKATTSKATAKPKVAAPKKTAKAPAKKADVAVAVAEETIKDAEALASLCDSTGSPKYEPHLGLNQHIRFDDFEEEEEEETVAASTAAPVSVKVEAAEEADEEDNPEKAALFSKSSSVVGMEDAFDSLDQAIKAQEAEDLSGDEWKAEKEHVEHVDADHDLEEDSFFLGAGAKKSKFDIEEHEEKEHHSPAESASLDAAYSSEESASTFNWRQPGSTYYRETEKPMPSTTATASTATATASSFNAPTTSSYSVSNPFGFGFTASANAVTASSSSSSTLSSTLPAPKTTSNNFTSATGFFQSVSSPLEKLCNLTNNDIASHTANGAHLTSTVSMKMPKSPALSDSKEDEHAATGLQTIVVDGQNEDFSAAI
jgi:hypothetical protein